MSTFCCRSAQNNLLKFTPLSPLKLIAMAYPLWNLLSSIE